DILGRYGLHRVRERQTHRQSWLRLRIYQLRGTVSFSDANVVFGEVELGVLEQSDRLQEILNVANSNFRWKSLHDSRYRNRYRRSDLDRVAGLNDESRLAPRELLEHCSGFTG